MPAQRIAEQTIADQSEQSLETLPHVCGSCRDIDACRGAGSEHLQLRPSAATICCSVAASNPRRTSILSSSLNTTVSSLLPFCSGLAISTASHCADSFLLCCSLL